MIGTDLAAALNGPDDWAAALSGASVAFAFAVFDHLPAADMTPGVLAGAGAAGAMAVKKIAEVYVADKRRRYLVKEANRLIHLAQVSDNDREIGRFELELGRWDPERLERLVRLWRTQSGPVAAPVPQDVLESLFPTSAA